MTKKNITTKTKKKNTKMTKTKKKNMKTKTITTM